MAIPNHMKTHDHINKEQREQFPAMFDPFVIHEELEKVKEGTKYDSKKVPLELLPVDALWETAKVLAYGKQKYKAWNWYSGIKYLRLFGAMMRHLYQWMKGKNFDKESGLMHLAHASCCLLFLLQFNIEERKELDDRPKWENNTADLFNVGFGVSEDGEI